MMWPWQLFVQAKTMCHSVHTWIYSVAFTHKYMYIFLVLAVSTIDLDQGLHWWGFFFSLGTLVNGPVCHCCACLLKQFKLIGALFTWRATATKANSLFRNSKWCCNISHFSADLSLLFCCFKPILVFCWDPYTMGCMYTDRLKSACAEVFKSVLFKCKYQIKFYSCGSCHIVQIFLWSW